MNDPVELSSNIYSPEFNAKMAEGEEDIKAGRTVKVTLDDLWDNDLTQTDKHQ